MTIDISAAEKAIIEKVLILDEGGWTLSHLGGDNDGGWTYAGCTSYTYMNFVYPGKQRSYDEMHVIVNGPLLSKVKDNVYAIYYSYLANAARLLGADTDSVEAYELSAIILCGAGGFKDIIASLSSLDNTAQYKIDFLAAWKAYLNSLNRPEFIRGWINRIAHYE